MYTYLYMERHVRNDLYSTVHRRDVATTLLRCGALDVKEKKNAHQFENLSRKGHNLLNRSKYVELLLFSQFPPKMKDGTRRKKNITNKNFPLVNGK
uniref:Uncharacterized protein n=1 Tax=Octopus bimaculoides TaxID=37653 RepID=A0A0L8GHI8_OCTBM